MKQNILQTLLLCLSYTSEEEKSETLALLTEEQWTETVNLAREHLVGSLLYHRLNPLNLSLPEKIHDILKREYLKQTMWNIYLYEELSRLLHIFRDREIPVIALKGTHLAELVYQNIGIRFMCDIDLLVKEVDLKRIEQELLAMGAEPKECNRIIIQENYEFGYKLPRYMTNLEIHWKLHSVNYPSKINLAEVWERARPAELSQAPAMVMDSVDLLLYLCHHAAIHLDILHLRMLVDLAELMRCYGDEWDWNLIRDRALEWELLRRTYTFVRLTQELLGAKISQQALDSLRPADFNEKYYTFLLEKLTQGSAIIVDKQASSAEARVWGTKGIRDKMQFMRKRIFLSREAMSVIYPPPATSWRIFLYYPVRIKRILFGYTMSYWNFLRGKDINKRIAIEKINYDRKVRSWLMTD